VSAGQINAQVPLELQSNAQYQVIINANGALSTPESIGMTALAPGVDVNPDGTMVAQHLDSTLVNAASPAKPNEYVVLYGAGFGATTPAVATGTGAPLSPVAQTADPAVITLNGEQAKVVFTGLTPGLAGLNQIDFQVPDDAANGDLTVAVSQAGVTTNGGTLSVHN
jgi:uncharacterized protein (TIGR03437 family)